jgi:predicted nucleic acid-binding Zn finger protein
MPLSSTAMTGWNAPLPPPEVLDPLSQLNTYLESQVNTLPNKNNNPDEILSVAEFLFGSAPLGSALSLLDGSGITKVSAPGPYQRSLYLVKGSKGSQSYICYTGKENSIEYCSCRSFLEKATKSNCPGQVVLCKHLLALKLMPYLSIKCHEVTTSSHEEFATLVMDRARTLGVNSSNYHSSTNRNT